MNSNRIAVALILLILLLCSCVPTPENLREQPLTPPEVTSEGLAEDGDGTGTTATEEETPIIERGNLNVIREQFGTDLKKKYKSFSITSARASEASAMPVYDIDIGINPDFDFDTLLERVYGEKYDIHDESNYFRRKRGDIITPDYPAYTEPTYNEEERQYINLNIYLMDIDGFTPADDITLSSYMYSLGNVWGSQTGRGNDGERIKWYYFETEKKHKRYDLYSDYPADDEIYTMADGQEWGATEAIEYVENFWNTYIAPSDIDNYKYSVKTLWVLDIDDGKFSYLFSIQRQDKDGNYFDVDKCDFYNLDNEYVMNNESFIFTNRLMTYCAEKETLTQYTKDFSFSRTRPTDDGNNLLTLGAACQALSDALARNMSLKLTAELNYVVYCKGYPYYQLWESPTFHEYKCLADCDFELRPVWCFRTPNQCYLQNSSTPERFFVDAVTGEVSSIVNYKYQKYSK